MDTEGRGEVVKGWLWGSGSHTNTVVALLPEKVRENGVFGAF